MPSTQNGRRAGDLFNSVGKVIAVILTCGALLGATGTAYLKAHQISVNTIDIKKIDERTTILEQFRLDDHYMTCVMFEHMNPAAVPASCDLAVSKQIKK